MGLNRAKGGQTGPNGPNGAKQGSPGPNRAKRGQMGPNRHQLSHIGIPCSIPPIPFPYLLSPMSYVLSHISYLLSPISYLQYPISYLLFPVPYLLSSIPYPLFPIAWCFVFLFNTSCIHNPKFLVWFFLSMLASDKCPIHSCNHVISPNKMSVRGSFPSLPPPPPSLYTYRVDR